MTEIDLQSVAQLRHNITKMQHQTPTNVEKLINDGKLTFRDKTETGNDRNAQPTIAILMQSEEPESELLTDQERLTIQHATIS